MITARDRIRLLNDELRRHHRGGQIVVTSGVSALGATTLRHIDDAISRFDEFTPNNDPYGEHDFGRVQIDGHCVLFKIDYYDPSLSTHSPDAADPSVTRRVMTIMLESEY